MDCDCRECSTHSLSRLYHWLESEPGPWLSVLPWGLLALLLICYLAW